MTPLYFGSSTRRLFGIYQEPRSRPYRDTGVLLCYPIGKEYMRSHWAFRQLAGQLARSGFHVFRFDYYGTGDSAGESGEGDVNGWRADIVAAAEELKDTAGTGQLAIVGLRFGAALAAVASKELNPRDLVLWDPVVSGERYLQQLRTLHKQLATSRSYFAKPRTDGAPDELLGYLYPAKMAETIAAADLLQTPIQARHVHLVVSQGQLAYRVLRRKLADSSEWTFTDHQLDTPADWDKLEQIENALLVGELPRTICDTLAQSK